MTSTEEIQKYILCEIEKLSTVINNTLKNSKNFNVKLAKKRHRRAYNLSRIEFHVKKIEKLAFCERLLITEPVVNSLHKLCGKMYKLLKYNPKYLKYQLKLVACRKHIIYIKK